jgi:AraC family transcriptional regulator of adaptative response/methylated-DNA-[protein]-cysteine methyltransferase
MAGPGRLAYRSGMETIDMPPMEKKARPGQSLDPEAAWTAVLERDGRCDGRFVYAVRTTGIFCRPTCPSRRPDRRHVVFFETSAAARAAGFRACFRCAPESSLAPAMAGLERVRAHIEAHLDERLTLDELAPVAGLSPTHLQRAFRAALGLSPREYVRARRQERFKTEVRRGRSVTDALYEAGYGSGSRLYEDAGARLGMTPGAYRRGGAGQVVRYTIAASPLGRLLVASTDRGYARSSSESPSVPSRPRSVATTEARVERDDRALRPSLAAILAHLEGEIRGSTCRSTWRQVPSSGGVARAAGNPLRGDAVLRRRRVGSGPAARGAGGGARLRVEPRGPARALPPRGAGGRLRGRLPLGIPTQEAPSRNRAGPGGREHRLAA